MLDLAIKHMENLRYKMYDTWFNEKYKYCNLSSYYSTHETNDNTWHEHEFVSIKDHEIIGYIGYEINRSANYCCGLEILNFTNDKITFGNDLKQVIRDIFEKFNFNKLKFVVVIGNPVEEAYDKIVQKYGGRITGIFREDVKLMDGNLYDVKQYEILKREYTNYKSNKRISDINTMPNFSDDIMKSEG